MRLRKNPLAYGCPYDQAREDPGMGRFRETLPRDACKRLDESRMCRYDRRSGAVAGTEVGRVGSHFYLRHESVREFNERLRQHATDADILVVVCSAYEFEQLKPRSDEVAELDRLRESEVCCPVKSDELFALADEPAGKAATLLQAHVSRAPFSAFTLTSDAAYVAKNAARVCRALFEMALRAHWPSLAERLLALAKAVERRLWWFQHPVRQLADLEPRPPLARGGRAAPRAGLHDGPAQRLHQQQGGRPHLPEGALAHTITPHRAHLSELRHHTQDFSPHAAKLDVNVHLRLASTFDSLALILKQLSPVRGSSRMELLEADGFVLQSFDTPTGLKFFVTADPDSKRLDEVLIRTYELYSDFVLKDPFYELEMPIRCESFDQKLQKLADDYHRR